MHFSLLTSRIFFQNILSVSIDSRPLRASRLYTYNYGTPADGPPPTRILQPLNPAMGATAVGECTVQLCFTFSILADRLSSSDEQPATIMS
jgi:hypothetical protein